MRMPARNTDSGLRAGWRSRNVSRSASDGGFTLVEVVLAVGISIGLLFVVMYFYHQAAGLREQALLAADKVSAIRLVMDQLTSDLRDVPPKVSLGIPLAGDAFSIALVRTDVPGRAGWTGGQLGRAARPETDLRFVSYNLGDGTNSVGLIRTEEPLVEQREVPISAGAVTLTEDADMLAPLPLTEHIQFMRFRFWDGAAWVDAWDSSSPPLAVEVTLGNEPLPEEVAPEDYPYELFRRVTFLPAGGPSGVEEMEEMEMDVMGIEVTSMGGKE